MSRARTSSQYVSAPQLLLIRTNTRQSISTPSRQATAPAQRINSLVHQSSSSKRIDIQCPFSGVVRQFCASLSLFGVYSFVMSSGSGKRVIGGRGENDVVSSSPPAARTRAQTRADRTEMNLDVISPRSTTVKATMSSSGPRGISPCGRSVKEINSGMISRRLPRLYCHTRRVSRMQGVASTNVRVW